MDSELKEFLEDISKRVKTIEGILIIYLVITILSIVAGFVLFSGLPSRW